MLLLDVRFVQTDLWNGDRPVAVRKAGRSRPDLWDALLVWRDTFATVETAPETMLSAAYLDPHGPSSVLTALRLLEATAFAQQPPSAPRDTGAAASHAAEKRRARGLK
jgi:hypothetical protein